MIPRDAATRFRGDAHLSGMGGSWQANNIADELRRAGLRTLDATEWLYDFNP